MTVRTLSKIELTTYGAFYRYSTTAANSPVSTNKIQLISAVMNSTYALHDASSLTGVFTILVAHVGPLSVADCWALIDDNFIITPDKRRRDSGLSFTTIIPDIKAPRGNSTPERNAVALFCITQTQRPDNLLLDAPARLTQCITDTYPTDVAHARRRNGQLVYVPDREVINIQPMWAESGLTEHKNMFVPTHQYLGWCKRGQLTPDNHAILSTSGETTTACILDKCSNPRFNFEVGFKRLLLELTGRVNTYTGD